MADFYEDFKNNINNRPEPDFNPADWADMDARLNESPKRAIPLFWWSTGALLLLLLGSNIWWIFHNEKMNSQVSNSTNTVVVRDTIIQREIIYQIDTVVQIQRIVEVENGEIARFSTPSFSQLLASNGLFPNNNNKFLSQKSALFQKEFPTSDLLDRVVSGLHKSNSSSSDSQIYSSFSDIKKDAEERNILDFLAMDLKVLPTEDFNLSDDIKGLPLAEREEYRRHALRNIWRGIQPTGFDLEAVGNFSILLNSEIESQSTLGGGLTAAVEFSPTLRLWISGNFEKISYKCNTQGEEYNIPVITPPFPELSFKYAEVSLPALHFASGLQYYFRTDEKWNPYLGIGVGGRSLAVGEIKYEYENGNIEVEEVRTIPKRNFQLEYLDFQTGIAYQWNDHWQARLGLEYLQYTKAESISSLRFQLGMGYRF